MFHLDEYIGLPMSHPASFRRFLQERLIQKVGLTNYHFLDGDTDPSATIQRVEEKPLLPLPSISHSLALARTAILRSMIRPLISRPRNLT